MKDAQLLDRFVRRRDQAAFAELVHIHGPMVFGVCKRVLKDHHDAEEAFQATFLILSHRAASIMREKQIGGWLYRVAYRASLHALRLKKRRRLHETHNDSTPDPAAKSEIEWLDIAPLLDHELNSLPEKYRVPVVLCDLEGCSQKEAAHQIGCPEGTLSSRLMRARNILAKRLSLKGIALPAAALSLLISQNAAHATIPTSVTLAAVQASKLGMLQALMAQGAVSPNVAQITNHILHSMMMNSLTRIMVAVTLIAGLGFGAVLLPQRPIKLLAHANVAAPDDDQSYEFAGTVVDENGIPAAGAKIWMEYWRRDAAIDSPIPFAVTDERGRFQFRCTNRDFPDEAEPNVWFNYGFLVAFKVGHGVTSGNKLYFETTGRMDSALDATNSPGWRTNVEKYWGQKSNTLTLAADDAPIRGRILNQYNQPVAGANVGILMAERSTDASLANWEAEARKPGASISSDALRLPIRPLIGGHINANDVRVTDPVLTDETGRFTLRGLGAERLAKIVVRGRGIETVVLDVRSRSGEILKVATSRPPSIDPRVETIYPNEFSINVGPSVAVEGTVTDENTKQPLADIVVRAELISSNQALNSIKVTVIRTMTDANGQYRLEGLPIGKNFLQLIPPAGYPYHNRSFTVTTKLNSASEVHVVNQTLQAGLATGMATKELQLVSQRTQQQLAPKADIGLHSKQVSESNSTHPSENDSSFRFSNVFVMGNAIMLAIILIIIVARRFHSR